MDFSAGGTFPKAVSLKALAANFPKLLRFLRGSADDINQDFSGIFSHLGLVQVGHVRSQVGHVRSQVRHVRSRVGHVRPTWAAQRLVGVGRSARKGNSAELAGLPVTSSRRNFPGFFRV